MFKPSRLQPGTPQLWYTESVSVYAHSTLNPPRLGSWMHGLEAELSLERQPLCLSYTRATLGLVDGGWHCIWNRPLTLSDLAQPGLFIFMVHKSPAGPEHILRSHNNNGIKHLYSSQDLQGRLVMLGLVFRKQRERGDLTMNTPVRNPVWRTH